MDKRTARFGLPSGKMGGGLYAARAMPGRGGARGIKALRIILSPRARAAPSLSVRPSPLGTPPARYPMEVFMSCEPESSIPDEHREAFTKRLARYGLTADSLHGSELRVTRDSMLTLSMSGNTHAQPRVLRTTDLDVVKRWVGVDDRVAQRYARQVCIPPLREHEPSGHAQVGGDAEKARAQRLRATRAGAGEQAAKDRESAVQAEVAGGISRHQLEAVQLAARTYVRGYSKAVPAGYKEVVEAVFAEFLIPIWAYTRVVVESGSVLQFGPGSNVLSAWEVEIQGTGTIRSKGHLTVDCRNLRHSQLVIANLAAASVALNP
jgi:hypothetical protein